MARMIPISMKRPERIKRFPQMPVFSIESRELLQTNTLTTCVTMMALRQAAVD